MKLASGSQAIQNQKHKEKLQMPCKYFINTELSCKNSQHKSLPEKPYYKTHFYRVTILQVLTQRLNYSIYIAILCIFFNKHSYKH